VIKRFILLATSIFILQIGIVVAAPKPVNAAVADGCNKSSTFFLNFPTWYEYLDVGPIAGDKCAIIGPKDVNGKFSWPAALGRIALAIVDILIRIAGIVALIGIIYGGFRYILSQGEPDNIKHAQGTIIAALIGLVIALLSTAIISFIGGALWK
jgi:hypothetical protein